MTHICVSKQAIIGSDNGLSPGRRQTIIWTNAGFLSIGPLRTYFNENLIKIQQFSLKKMHVKMSSAKWRPSCLGLNELNLPEELPNLSRLNELGQHWFRLMACCLFCAKQLSKPIQTFVNWKQTSAIFWFKLHFLRKCIGICRQQNVSHFNRSKVLR